LEKKKSISSERREVQFVETDFHSKQLIDQNSGEKAKAHESKPSEKEDSEHYELWTNHVETFLPKRKRKSKEKVDDVNKSQKGSARNSKRKSPNHGEKLATKKKNPRSQKFTLI